MPEINHERLEALVGRIVGDMAAASSVPLVILGDRLGLYRALASAPATPAQLAERTGTNERYVREWCAAQAAAGYIDHRDGSFSLSPEQRAAFADGGPAEMVGGFYAIASAAVDEPTITDAFRTGAGVGWGEHSTCLFCGTERFFRAGYLANLVGAWLPALDGVVAKLQRGATVADVGCGHGASTVVMARAFPKSRFVGFDFHAPSVACATARAEEEGLDNIRFEVASAKDFPGRDYDLVAMFDCLHDMGDPVGGAAHARQALKPDGTFMVVEPFAHDRLEDNLNPVGRLFYSLSTMICTPASRSQEVGLALGAQAGPKRLEEVIREGGFAHFRVATATPFNLVLEARP